MCHYSLHSPDLPPAHADLIYIVAMLAQRALADSRCLTRSVGSAGASLHPSLLIWLCSACVLSVCIGALTRSHFPKAASLPTPVGGLHSMLRGHWELRARQVLRKIVRMQASDLAGFCMRCRLSFCSTQATTLHQQSMNVLAACCWSRWCPCCSVYGADARCHGCSTMRSVSQPQSMRCCWASTSMSPPRSRCPAARARSLYSGQRQLYHAPTLASRCGTVCCARCSIAPSPPSAPTWHPSSPSSLRCGTHVFCERRLAHAPVFGF